MTSVTCAECGVQFEFERRKQRRPRRLCSKRCANLEQRARVSPEKTAQWQANAREARRAKREALNPRVAVADLPGEEWRPVLGLEGMYEVSSRGRARSLDRVIESSGDAGRARYKKPLRGKLLVVCADATGYLAFYTPRGHMRVHVLVCEAFHGPKPLPTHEVRHLNGNPLDNRPENLAWGTSSENTQDMLRHGTGRWFIKNHCKYGHEFTPENTYKRSSGVRSCLECTRRRRREGMRRKRARDRAVREAAA